MIGALMKVFAMKYFLISTESMRRFDFETGHAFYEPGCTGEAR